MAGTDGEQPEVTRAYRCGTCGCWSGTERGPVIPVSHARFIAQEYDEDHIPIPPRQRIIRPAPGGNWVHCGPFEPFEAVRVP